MKRDKQTIEKRHRDIVRLLNEQNDIKVDELAKILDISLITARRDLQQLEKQGILRRYHGGAVLNTDENSGMDLRTQKARDAISRYAATLVEDGDSLFINGSMTASGILEYLQAKNVMVITNNGYAPGYIKIPTIQIYLTGGLLKGHIMIGDFCVRNLLSSYQKKAFLGCSGISSQGEILCGIPAELGINETMISHAEHYYILADSTKFEPTKSLGSFTIEQTGTIITDADAPRSIVQMLESKGMKVILVDPETAKPIE